jgi:hypothetical protein
MTASQRIRRAAPPTAAAAVIGAGGFAIGAAAAGPGDTAIPANMARDIAGQLIQSGQGTSGG